VYGVSATVISRDHCLIKGKLTKDCAIKEHDIDLGLDINIS
jgi:hypothetical protein